MLTQHLISDNKSNDKAMPNTLALIALVAPTMQTTLVVVASADSVVTLVCIIKSIR